MKFVGFLRDIMEDDKNNDKVKSEVGDLIEGAPKAPFSIATTPRCRGERYSFPWIAPLYP